MPSGKAVIVGAGIGGLAAAAELAARGVAVTVVERQATEGGKMREVALGGRSLDAGPTVLTMRWVLDDVFAATGAKLEDHLQLRPAGLLARHAWSDAERLDLHADLDRSTDAIADFAGPSEARRFVAFTALARDMHDTLERTFLREQRGSVVGLARRGGVAGLAGLWRTRPFSRLWRVLGDYFHDPRLRQLFGRYATYCGSSPFLAPGPLLMIAHAERAGVWLCADGMHSIASALKRLAERSGARFRFDSEVASIVVEGRRAAGVRLCTGERIASDAVIVNADVSALAQGRFGTEASRAVSPVPRSERSLSAITWMAVAKCEGFPLVRHNVFFSRDYAAEFDDIARGRVPCAPTVYVCAQDRDDSAADVRSDAERLLVLVNAPPDGDHHRYDSAEIDECTKTTFDRLARCGLRVQRTTQTTAVTTPTDFDRLYPGTGGALYGRASQGWQATFRRPGAVSRIPGLYLAGGSAHPGPGVPMAALSGRLAASALLADLASTRRSFAAVTPGGMSTR